MKSNDGNKNKGYSKIATIIGIVFIIYFITSIGGMVYYSKRNPMMCLFLFGTYFLILGSLGVLSIINEKTVKKNLVIFIFPLVGIGAVIYSSISMWGNITISEKAAPFILLLVFIIAGAVILLKTILSSKNKTENWIMISAKCIGLDQRYSTDSNGRSKIVYAPKYSYNYFGTQYNSQSELYSNIDIPEVGTYQDVYINPKNPSEIYRMSIKNNMFLIILGIIFVLSGTVGLYFLFK